MSGHTRSLDFVDVEPLLAPRSIAVIGASDDPSNLGGVAVRRLQKFGYPGPIWPVHPRAQEVAGLPCFAKVGDLPEPAELAVFAVAAERVVDLVAECADFGIRHGIVFAGGFVDDGPEGARLQAELENTCRATGFSLLGPNCLGVINAQMPMTATFAAYLVEKGDLMPGGLSIAGQSGGLVTMAAALARSQGFGVRYVVSTGNEALVTTADFVHAFVRDEQTRVIALYLEGSRDGAKFLEALIAARTAGKPVVVLKAGSTRGSAQAAAAHTGALAGEALVWEAVLREYAIQVYSLEELLDVSLHLSGTGGNVIPAGNRAVIVTFSGGSGVLSVDQCERAGLVTPHLSQSTRERLKSLVPPTASIANPVDLTAPAAFNRPEWQARFPVSLDAIAADPNVDVVLMQFGPMAHGGPEIAQAVCDFSLRVEKALCLSWRLAPAGVPELLREHKMHFFEEDNRAIEVVAKLAASGSLRAARDKRHGSPVSFNWGEFVPESRPNLVVTEHDCHRLLAAFGLQTARGRLAVSEQDVLDAALAVSWPVALKAISPAVTHRAAAGLLALGVTSDDEARAEYRRLIDQAATLAVSLDGVYVQQMEDEGAELLVSAFRDSTFGVVVSCGAGGVMTESLDDVTFELAPVDAEGALEMLQRLRVVKGLRHLNPGVNLAAVADYIAEFSRLAATAPWQRFVFELNPVKWGGERVVAVDALLIIDSP